MSQFRVDFNEMREGGSFTEAPSSAPKDKEERLYETPGYSRALRFVWPDGQRRFFQYGSLDNANCSADETTLTLTFNRDTVVLKGRYLADLLEEISQQLVRIVTITEERYLELEEIKGPMVIEIIVTPN